MKIHSEHDLRRTRRSGLKPALARALATEPLNTVLRRVLRRAGPRTAVRLPLSLPHVDYLLANGQSVRLLDPGRDQVARDIYWGRGQPTSHADARILRLIERLCASGVQFVDIGAFAGLFALVAVAAGKDTDAITFEIVPENHLSLLDNILVNDRLRQVDARLVGLGRAPGELRIPRTLNLSSRPSSLSLGSHFASGVVVPVDTLDAQLPHDPRPLVMKLDVEGFEADVLAGATRTLAQRRPTMVCEVLRGGGRQAEIESMLSPLGYRYFLSTDTGFEERARLEPAEGARDYVLTTDAALLESISA